MLHRRWISFLVVFDHQRAILFTSQCPNERTWACITGLLDSSVRHTKSRVY